MSNREIEEEFDGGAAGIEHSNEEKAGIWRVGKASA